jgi:phage shock protein C
MEQKKLLRSNTNKMIAGVCGGIAEYINLDPTVVRLLWVIFCFAGGTGILAYIVAAIIIPSQY